MKRNNANMQQRYTWHPPIDVQLTGNNTIPHNSQPLIFLYKKVFPEKFPSPLNFVCLPEILQS